MTEDNDSTVEVAKTERIGLGDLVIAGFLALITFLSLTIWEFPGLYPGVWKEAAVAAFVRPAENVIPGYWTAIASVLYKFFGIQGGMAALRVVGHIILSGVAICVYAVLREWLSFAMHMRPQFSIRRTIVMRLASALGTIAFVTADPIWTAGQCLSENTILLALTLAAIELFFVFLRKNEIKYAYLCVIPLGLLAAESSMGFALPVVLFVANMIIMKMMPTLESPFIKPAIMEVGKWHMTFLFIASLLVGVAINSGTFLLHGGVGAAGGTIGSLPLHYLLDYWHRLSTCASPISALLWLVVCFTPFIVSTVKFPSSADEEHFLPYGAGIIFFICGIMAFSQSTFIPALWFWTYHPMASGFLLSVGLFCCAATLALSLTILGVDSLCRNHFRLAQQLFGDPNLDESVAVQPVLRGGSTSSALIRRATIVLVPLFLIVMMVPSLDKTTTRLMLEVIEDSITEIAREAGPAAYLFTDGNLDDVIEIESARQGGSLKCYDLMGGEGNLACYLRTRNLKDEEDVFAFRHDAGMGLRTWIRDKPDRLKDAAALMGFDLWKRDGKPLPPMGGFLSRLTGFSDEKSRVAGIESAHRLADRILDIHSRRSGVSACTDESIRRKFLTLQWRIARMCTYRSEAEDLVGHSENAISEALLAKKLNDCNKIYQDLVSMLDRRNALLMQKLTPREGLQLALVRADFTMGKCYAETILNADPENPDASFALGMFYLEKRQFSRAETYLKRCLIRKPKEPAIYNNLAMLQIEQGRFDAARANIEKALKIVPNSAAVVDTQRALDAAIKKSKEPPKKVRKASATE